MSGSSLREKQLPPIVELSNEEIEHLVQENLELLRSRPNREVDTSDIPELTSEEWARSVPNPLYRPVKDQVTLRIDRPVLEWFKANHDKYQTAINEALRDHMNRERKTS